MTHIHICTRQFWLTFWASNPSPSKIFFSYLTDVKMIDGRIMFFKTTRCSDVNKDFHVVSPAQAQ